ncbi:hypothetical protein V8939_18690, partial [Acinetobacter pittii]
LQVFAEDDAATALLDTTDAAEIEATLQEAGVRFERWPLKPVTADSDVLAVYADEVARLTADGGYQSIDVARIAPDHPDRATLREKFLSEHTHGE